MAVKVKLFGQLKQMAGASEMVIDASDTDGVVKEMVSRFPELKNLNYLIAVNKNIVQANTVIYESQEIALLPPYSGG